MNEANIHSWVDGKPLAGSGKAFVSINPATGQVLAHLHDADAGDVDLAVASAQRGFEVWSAMSGTERGRILRKAADLLRSCNEELAALEVQDCGKPIQEALVVDVMSGADCIEYFQQMNTVLSRLQSPNVND
jgi:betaine-aldehyde dehydrogenase